MAGEERRGLHGSDGAERWHRDGTGTKVFVPGHGSPGDGPALQERLAADRAYILALRSGADVSDPRVDRPKPGWEWIGDLHAGQAAAWERRRARR